MLDENNYKKQKRKINFISYNINTMPMIIKQVTHRGYKVCEKNGRCYSSKPLPLKRAKAQRIAINLSKLGIKRPMMKGMGSDPPASYYGYPTSY
jgi:hypothetical protein